MAPQGHAPQHTTVADNYVIFAPRDHLHSLASVARLRANNIRANFKPYMRHVGFRSRPMATSLVYLT